jgi:RND superfamily putative drug exporter
VTQSRLYRWGVAVARRRRVVLGVYLLVLCLCAAAYPSLQAALGPPSYKIKSSESSRVEDLLESSFPGLGSESDALVFNSSRHLAGDPVYRGVIAAVDGKVRVQTGVRTVLGPYDHEAVGQIASNEQTAFSAVSIGGSPQRRFEGTRAIQGVATRAAGNNGVRVWLTGYSPIAKDTSEVQKADSKQAQAIAVPLALVILLLAMGSVVAALLPLLLAITGLLLADGVLALLVLFFHFDTLVLAVMTLIGLGIGIDYALFIVSRIREELARSSDSPVEQHGEPRRVDHGRSSDSPAERHGEPRRVDHGRSSDGPAEQHGDARRVDHAVGVALATSGSTILFAGAIVACSLASLFVVDSQFLQEIAIGAVVVVVCMLTTALTMLPAVLSLLGARVNRGALPRLLQPADARPASAHGQIGAWARWALAVMRHPVPVTAAAVTVLAVVAIPALHLRYGLDASVIHDTNTISGKGEKVLAESISPGLMAPLEVVVSGGGAQHLHVDAAAKRLTEELELDPGVTGLAERRSRAGALLYVLSSKSIDSLQAKMLVERIRKKLAPPIEARGGPTVLVGGSTAQIVDLSNELKAKTPLILALILGLSLLLLVVVFRSIVLPIKAVLMNLLATVATLGLAVLVFQDGHGEHLLNFTSSGFVQIGVPQIMFALLFGLSMDYEVFLIRRMQEEWKRTGDNRLAVATGMEHTARPITAAAAIMVVVFGSFVVAHVLELKELGFVLAVAIALDATLVRLVLVPAVMGLFGAWNWWLPAWLGRVLPDLQGR